MSLLAAGRLAAHAQGLPGNGGTTGGPPAPQATTVPLNGGASLLLAAGIGLALCKLRRKA
ncbi:MAG: PID-CTERM protein-sorting domain-containing protein [Janthinobacterium lividum]